VVVLVLCFVADILKANDEVIRVMALYEDTVHRPDTDSLLIDHANEEATHGQYILPTCAYYVVCLHQSISIFIMYLVVTFVFTFFGGLLQLSS